MLRTLAIQGFITLLMILSLWNIVQAAEAKKPAVDPVMALSFKQWKTQQIVEAQNQVARFANKSLLIKSNDPNKMVISSDGDNLDELEKQLKQARIRLEVAQELNFDDYVAIYLSQFSKDKARLEQLAAKLTTQDVAEILEYMSSKSSSSQPSGPSKEPVVGGAPSMPVEGSNL